MSQQVKVQRKLSFYDAANLKANVGGNMLEEKKHFSDNFMGDTLDTNKWTATVGGSGDAIAISEVSGGECLLTTGGNDNDTSHLGSAIIFRGSKYPVIEARITIDDVTGTALFFGFSDAKSESNGSLAIEYPANSLTTNATDAVGFVCDADHTSSLLMCCGVYGDTDATAVSSGITWTDGQTKNLRITLEGTIATFYVDGVPVGSLPVAVTSTTLLCAAVQVATRAADGQNTVHLHRIDVWQTED
jgi:hypothetical protein